MAAFDALQPPVRSRGDDMSRDETVNSLASSLWLALLFSGTSNGQEEGLYIQADVYDTLYEAHVACDEELDQSRSEFITDMFQRNRDNPISMELLTKLLSHNVEVAKQSIAQKTQERVYYVDQVLAGQKESSGEPIYSSEMATDAHAKIEQIDGFLKRERRQVELDECVLSFLQEAEMATEGRR